MSGKPGTLRALAVTTLVVAASLILPAPAYGTDSAPFSAPGGGHWAFDPDYTGEQIPPTGRSLFDYLFSEDLEGKAVYRIPYPFSALREHIEARLEPRQSGTSVRQVLIPHGRSLQRGLAAPGYFRFPRVVLVVDTGPRWQEDIAGMLLKDRLYIGYQEKADLLEVISYNETAARFEFQIVRNYTQDRNPEVSYANRSVCLACHQNQAPIFSRPLWSETDANPQIAAALQHIGRNFYAIPVAQGIDIPNAIDDATDRANLFAVTQALWRKGCEAEFDRSASIDCRAWAFTQMLRYRLGGKQDAFAGRSSDTDAFAATFNKNWQQHWPGGMAIPNPDIPNRNPLEADALAGQAGSLRLDINLVAGEDPLAPRPPVEIWSRKQATQNLITGLSAFVADTDMRRLDAFIYRTAKGAGAELIPHRFTCELSVRRRAEQVYRVSFVCPGAEGRVYVDHSYIRGGSIDRLKPDRELPVISDVEIAGGEVHRDGERERIRLDIRKSTLHARLANGNAIDSIELSFKIPEPDGNARVKRIPADIEVNELDDFALVREAIDRLRQATATGAATVLTDQSFVRPRMMQALFGELGMLELNWCCDLSERMPAVVQATHVQEGPDSSAGVSGFSGDEKRFFQYCASCHLSNERFPPNFLEGSVKRVRTALKHCAPRIRVRLNMWSYPAESRSKSPMPPFRAIHQQFPDTSVWQTSADLRALQDYMEELAAAQAPVPAQNPLRSDYESLRECLP